MANTKMNQAWGLSIKGRQPSPGHLTVGQTLRSFHREGPKSKATCRRFLEGEGDWMGGFQVNPSWRR